MKVVWTAKAKSSFNGIIDYLLDIWNVEIANRFADEVEHVIEQIIDYPEMFKSSGYDQESREAFITTHTTMFYRVLDDTIEIEYFWGNFDDPNKIKELRQPK